MSNYINNTGSEEYERAMNRALEKVEIMVKSGVPEEVFNHPIERIVNKRKKDDRSYLSNNKSQSNE